MTQTVYVAKAGNGVKVGVSKNPEKRINQLNTANSSDVELLHELKSLEDRGRTAKEWEAKIHDHLSDYHMSGEWFSVECLDSLYEFLEWYETDVELTERQANALGVALTLQDSLPRLHEVEHGKVVDPMPERGILRTIVNEYNLPHGVCDGCARLAHYHLSDSGDRCIHCNIQR